MGEDQWGEKEEERNMRGEREKEEPEARSVQAYQLLANAA